MEARGLLSCYLRIANLVKLYNILHKMSNLTDVNFK